MQIGGLAEGTKHKTKTAALKAAAGYLEDGYFVRVRWINGSWWVGAYYGE